MDMEDPRAMRRLMKEMSGAMGDDMDGEDFDPIMEEAMEEEAGGGGVSSSDAAGGEDL
jgi:hypothetical protein